jgi:hypothetical protein
VRRVFWASKENSRGEFFGRGRKQIFEKSRRGSELKGRERMEEHERPLRKPSVKKPVEKVEEEMRITE